MVKYFRDYIDVREEDEVKHGPKIAENRYFKLIEAFFEMHGFTFDTPWKYEYRQSGNGLERTYHSRECGDVIIRVEGTHLKSTSGGKGKARFSTHIRFDPNVSQPWRHKLSSQGGFLAGIKDLEKRIEE
jgi:hypothetical protein